MHVVIDRAQDVGTEQIVNHPTPSVLDVGTLESAINPKAYRELLAAFLTYLSVQVDELNRAAQSRDVVAAQFVAHQIKGTASSFGAARLDELAERLLRLDVDRGDDLRSVVDEIGQAAARLQGVVHV
jgi:HPt (histidine-containing phosphotransfer) domain-containing protein